MRDIEEVIDNTDHVRDLTVQHLPRPRRLNHIAPRAPQNFEGESHRGQRISQFMCQDAEELVLPLVQQAQGFRVNPERFRLPRVGHIVHGQKND
jgi:hypothetical protein